MSPRTLRGRTRPDEKGLRAAKARAVDLDRGRGRLLRHFFVAPEELEDRTLLSNGAFAALAISFGGELANLQNQLTNVLDHAASVPLVGPVLGDQAPAKFINELRSNVQAALTSLDSFQGGPSNGQILF